MFKHLLSALLVIVSIGASAQVQELRDAQDKRREAFKNRGGGQLDKASETRKKVPVTDPLEYVNPFIGTGGHGHTFPGPVVPFGMVQVGPDTRYEGWDGCSGYHYSDSMIYGFSHTHLSGTGIPDYSDLLIVPQVGKAKTEGKFKNPKGYGASFSHSEEEATAGFYKVKLKDPNVDVRLTATMRCALHEYTFNTAKGKKFLVLDLGYRDKVIDAGATTKNNNEVSGFRISKAWADNQHFYFNLQTNIPFSKAKWVLDKEKGTYVMVLEFPANTRQVLVRVGISGTDEAGAANNLKAEIASWNFDNVLKDAQALWSSELSAVQAFSTDKTILTNFYTGLYHAYVHPSLWSDVDGRYRDYNNVIQAGTTDMYSVFSLWDTYRGANPLYTILQPERVSDFVESFYQQYRNRGTLPVWTLSNNETYCMIGYHAASVISDAAMKGIDLKHMDELLGAMTATSNYDHFGIRQYVANGFISAGDEAESVSKTLEYAYDDWCIAQFAKKTGNDSIAAVYTKRAASWMNLYNPESGFFQARSGGMWLPNFLPNEVNHHFTEANAWQYSLAAPHHIASLIQLKGPEKKMERFLDSLFLSSSSMSGREQADITGLIGQYAHGNEPSHHMAYLYNYCGAPHKTQELLDKVMRNYYRTTPDGLSGNEDCGQMSAWYVMSALGFYPVSPGSPTYAIGRPMIDRCSIKAGEKAFTIVAQDNSPENKYIQSIKWNGEKYKKLYITHEMITSGGSLILEMGPKPNRELSKYETDLNDKVSPDFIAAPSFLANSQVFGDAGISVNIEKLPVESGVIVYTTDGEEPDYKSPVFDKSLTFYSSLTLKARIYRESEGGKISYGPVVSTNFVHFTQDKTIALETAYANQYAGGSTDALIDGQKGGNDYRSDGWQGFEGKDVVAVITLDEAKEIQSVTASFLQDTKSWIFHPKALTVEVSTDGVNYKKIGTKESTEVSDRQEGTIPGSLGFDFGPLTAKYVRVTVKNYGLCPDWHLGAGGKTWIFLDEISVE